MIQKHKLAITKWNDKQVRKQYEERTYKEFKQLEMKKKSTLYEKAIKICGTKRK